jgi:hypothetical protein
MRRYTHHGKWILEIEQCLVKIYTILGRRYRLLRARRR